MTTKVTLERRRATRRALPRHQRSRAPAQGRRAAHRGTHETRPVSNPRRGSSALHPSQGARQQSGSTCPDDSPDIHAKGMLTTAGTSWLPHPNKRPHPDSTVVLCAIRSSDPVHAKAALVAVEMNGQDACWWTAQAVVEATLTLRLPTDLAPDSQPLRELGRTAARPHSCGGSGRSWPGCLRDAVLLPGAVHARRLAVGVCACVHHGAVRVGDREGVAVRRGRGDRVASERADCDRRRRCASRGRFGSPD